MLKSSSLEYIRAIAKKYEAEKVLLFGSCLTKSMDKANDIDLAVYGLCKSKHWDMYMELSYADELDDMPVDLLRAEDDAPLMVFAREGLPIYERKNSE